MKKEPKIYSREELKILRKAKLTAIAVDLNITVVPDSMDIPAIVEAILTAQEQNPETENAAEQPEANLVFVGRRKKRNKLTGETELVEKELYRSINTPRGEIVFPEGIRHGVPFYCEQAEYLKQVFRNDFKKPKNLGE